MLALYVPSSFVKDKNRVTRTLYRIGKRCGRITNTKNEWIFLNAIRYLGFGMHEAATTGTKIYNYYFIMDKIVNSEIDNMDSYLPRSIN